MFARIKRNVAVLLAGIILLAGSGFSGAFAAAVEHAVGIESSLATPPSEDGEVHRKCEHGCASHLSVHLTMLTQAQPLSILVEAPAEPQSGALYGAISARPDSFFRPPRYSLA
jgi:hypothetical protein